MTPYFRYFRPFVVALSLSLLVAASCARPAAPTPQLVDVQVLAFNDFHGALEPVDGGNGRLENNVVGGVEYLATQVARLKAQNPNTLVVSAGDNIGATPLLSSMFHDEPSVEALNDAGLQVSAVGNHEFDEGWWELLRMQRGGCHPVDGCQDRTPFSGARFQYLSANVVVDPAAVDQDRLRRSGWTPGPNGSRTLFPASTVRTVGGIRIGLIGLVVRTAPEILMPVSVKGLTFRDEADAANEEVAKLTAQGVHTIIVLIHEGATPARDAYNGCEGVTGPVMEIAARLSPEVDAVVAGHVHRAYNCTVDGKLVTSGASLGRVITDIDLKIDARTGDVVSKSARNTLVSRDVPARPAATALLAHYRPFAEALGSQPVGTITAEISRDQNDAGESPLGDLVADAMLAAGRSASPGPAVAAIMNTGGIRAGLVGAPQPGGTLRNVTYAQAFEVSPFGNRVQVKTITGAGILRWLEQQFDNPGPGRTTILQVAGIEFSYQPTRPAGQRVQWSDVRIGGNLLDPAAQYRIVSNDFVWSGGDAFTAAREGTNPVDVGADVDVLVTYLKANPAAQPGRQNRITRLR